MVTDTNRLRKELGYTEPVSKEEALARTIEWERAHPPDKENAGHFDYAAEDAVLSGVERQTGSGAAVS